MIEFGKLEYYLLVVNAIGALAYLINLLLYRHTANGRIDVIVTIVSLLGGSAGMLLMILLFDRKAEKEVAQRYIDDFRIKVTGQDQTAGSLSGGNQQKIVIGRSLSTNPKLVILDEPTRGIDVGAKREIHALLRQLAESGVGVIVVSSELPEVIGVSDRVAVMHEGCLAGFLEGEEVTEENIMKLASGEQLAEKELRQ